MKKRFNEGQIVCILGESQAGGAVRRDSESSQSNKMKSNFLLGHNLVLNDGTNILHGARIERRSSGKHPWGGRPYRRSV